MKQKKTQTNNAGAVRAVSTAMMNELWYHNDADTRKDAPSTGHQKRPPTKHLRHRQLVDAHLRRRHSIELMIFQFFHVVLCFF